MSTRPEVDVRRTIMIGAHLIRTYSKTQATIAKSSGESELMPWFALQRKG